MNKKKMTKTNKKKILGIGILAVCFCMSIVILAYPYGQSKKAPESLTEYSSVNTITELATLKVFYHNVTIFEEEPSGGAKFFNNVLMWPFGGVTNVGYKQYWLEYSGIVEIGVDASRIRIGEPNAEGIVEVYVPEAKVLNVYADEASMSEPLSETGLFTKISWEEKVEAFANAQRLMREQAEKDSTALNRAKEHVKTLLKNYIINTGRGMGKEYTVRWIEETKSEVN